MAAKKEEIRHVRKKLLPLGNVSTNLALKMMRAEMARDEVQKEAAYWIMRVVRF